jgi:hypothetical protein
MRRIIVILYLFFAARLTYCDEEIASLAILIYEDGNVTRESYIPELEAEGMKFAIFYEVTESAVRRHYVYEDDIRTADYTVLSRINDKDKERIYATNPQGGQIEIIYFPNNHAIIIYYDNKILSIEEALFIKKSTQG